MIEDESRVERLLREDIHRVEKIIEMGEVQLEMARSGGLWWHAMKLDAAIMLARLWCSIARKALA